MGRAALAAVAVILAGVAAYLAYAFTVIECATGTSPTSCGSGTVALAVLAGYGAVALQGTPGVPEPSTAVLGTLTEKAFQRMVVEGLKQRGYVVWTFPEMRFTRAGVPDLIFWHPDRPGRLHCWELKRETKYRVSPDQRAALEHLSTVDGVDARILRPSQWRVASEEV